MVEFKAPTVLELLEKDLQWATQEFGPDDPHVRAMKKQLDEMRGGSATKPVHFAARPRDQAEAARPMNRRGA